MFLLSFVLGLVPVPMVAQNRAPSDYIGSYYYQAYDQGFRSGRADYLAGRPYGYHAALLTTAGRGMDSNSRTTGSMTLPKNLLPSATAND
jgi:hypothetical protein